MTRLMVVNTYYQLIVCLQLTNTFFKDDNTVLCITDHSKNSRNVAKKLSEEKIFNEVVFIENKTLDFADKKLMRIKDSLNISFDKTSRYNELLMTIKTSNIDEILFYNTGYLFIDALLSFFSNSESEVLLSMFEEGILSYEFEFDFFKSRKMINRIRKIRNRKTINELTTKFYCFYPSLYVGDLNAIKIPLISDKSTTSEQLRKIFNPDLSNYTARYIFFTSVYDFEGGKPIGEYNLVCKVAKLVGRDNLIVKMHPRDSRTIYEDNGFNVDRNSIIPWEAIQLSGNFFDKIFLTVNSGSVLAGSFMSENPVRTYFMYKLCDFSDNLSCLRTISNIEHLLSKDSMREVLRRVKIAEKLEDIL